MKSASNKKRTWMLLGAVVACLGGVRTAKADIMLTFQSVSAAPGSINDQLNVYATNVGSAPVDVEAFQFEINTASTDITFEQATTGTTLFPYIFAMNSFFGPVISTSSPGQTLDASDVTATANSFTAVGPGDSFGLGLVSFDVAPGAANQAAQLTFNMDSLFTNVSDQNGNLQPLRFGSGSITVTTVSPVPEPASGVLLLAPVAFLIWRNRFRRH